MCFNTIFNVLFLKLFYDMSNFNYYKFMFYFNISNANKSERLIFVYRRDKDK